MSIELDHLKSPEDLGRWVVYRAWGPKAQEGRIKSWNGKFIHVVYDCGGNWNEYEKYTAAATLPNDLEFKGPI